MSGANSHGIFKFALTGSSGWLGQSVFHIAERYLNVAKAEILIVPSIADLKNSLPIINQSIDTFVPLAFPPRESFNRIGKFKFLQSARDVMKRDLELLKQNLVKNVILISTGEIENEYFRPSEDYRAYREMKSLQESQLTKASIDYGFNLTICRVYSVTSSSVTNFNSFAFLNFVDKAMKNEQITIQSGGYVFRKYLDFGQLFQALFLNRSNKGYSMLSSSGELVEIRDLAKLIIESCGSKSELTQAPITDIENRYYSESESDYFLIRKYVGEPLTLNAQIDNVKKAWITTHAS